MLLLILLIVSSYSRPFQQNPLLFLEYANRWSNALWLKYSNLDLMRHGIALGGTWILGHLKTQVTKTPPPLHLPFHFGPTIVNMPSTKSGETFYHVLWCLTGHGRGCTVVGYYLIDHRHALFPSHSTRLHENPVRKARSRVAKISAHT